MKLQLSIEFDNKEIVDMVIDKYGHDIIDCLNHGEDFMTYHFWGFPYGKYNYNGTTEETMFKVDFLVYVDNDRATGLSVSLDTIYVIKEHLLKTSDMETRQEIGRMLTERIEELWNND